jgi:hypothetical protein
MSATGLGSYKSNWRASACEAVPYGSASDGDFPAALLTWPEVPDNAIFCGNAKEININVDYCDDGYIRMLTSNNGKSMSYKDTNRYTEWTSSASTSGLNNYGHGEKKHLTKAQPEYAAERQWAKYSRPHGGPLTKISGPFRNTADMIQEDVDEPSILPNGGVATETFIRHELLNTITRRSLSEPNKLFSALKELVRSRYGQYIDDRSLKFHLNINGEHTWDSGESQSLESYLKGMVERGAAKLCIEKRFDIPGGYMLFTFYHIYSTMKEEISRLKEEFPIYGLRGNEGSRIFISKENRMIEPRPLHKILNRSPHDDFNGYKGFIKFCTNTGSLEECNLLPEATTTKVAFNDDNVAFRNCLDFVRESLDQNKPKGGWMNLKAPAAPTPNPIPINTNTQTIICRINRGTDSSSVSSEEQFADSTFACDAESSVSSPTNCQINQDLDSLSPEKRLASMYGIEITGRDPTVYIKLSPDEVKTINGKGVATVKLRDVLIVGALTRSTKEAALKYLRLQIESYN